MEKFKNQLIHLREKKKLTGPEVAFKAKIPYRTYNNYENGTFPPLERIIAIIHVLDITFDDLFQPFLPSETEEIQGIIRRFRSLYKNSQMRSDIIRALTFLEFEHQLQRESPRGEGRAEEGK